MTNDRHTPGPCRCRVKNVRFSPGNPNGQFEVVYCVTHAKAREMRDTIKALLTCLDYLDADSADPDERKAVDDTLAEARTLLREIEGED